MRRCFFRSIAFLAALAAPVAAQKPTATPASAVEPADQSAVAPALPMRAAQPNSDVVLGAPTPPPTPAVEPFPVPPELVPASAREEAPSVSSPPSSTSPAAGSAHARAGVVTTKPVTLSQGAASTVTSYRKGKSLVVKLPSGSLVEYRLGKDTVLPSDLAAGRQVLVETKFVKKHRVATKVSYAEGRVVLTNVN